MQTTIGNYVLLKELGSGSFSTVWQAMHVTSQHICAIKEIKKASLPDKTSENYIIKEVAIMQKLKHPLAVTFYDYFTNEDNYYIVMEYAEHGSLNSLIKSSGRFNEVTAKKYCIQILLALEYLHNERKIAHRDLKPDNILLDKNSNILLSDFGLSSEFSVRDPLLHTVCGSPLYVAPELIQSRAYSNKIDIWSLGVILYRMVVGSYPFEHENIQNLYDLIINSQPKYPSFLSPFLVDLLKKLLTKEPDLRPTVGMIKKHQWFNSAGCVLFKIPNMDPNIDLGLIKQVSSYGIDITNLPKDLLIGAYNSKTAIYWMLWVERKAEIVSSWGDRIIRSGERPLSISLDHSAIRHQFNFKTPGSAQQPSSPLEVRFGIESTKSPQRLGTASTGQRIMQIPQVPAMIGRRMSRPNAVRKPIFTDNSI